MLLRNPFFRDNLWRDQPYSSMLLVAPYCDFKCNPCFCQNAALKNASLINFSIDELVKEFKSNPFVDGITLAGLEPFLSSEVDSSWWSETISFIEKAEIKKVTIYTRFEKTDEEVSDVINKITSLENVNEFYLKTGMFIKDSKQKEIKIRDWTLTLASDNQNFERVK